MNQGKGLTSQEAASRAKAYGLNQISRSKSHEGVALFLQQFRSPITLILLAATFVSVIVGDRTSAFIILGIIVPSGVLAFMQERQAGNIMKSLLSQVAIHTEVIRDGVEKSLPATEIVPGDCVVLRVGDLVPADGTVVESNGLLVDESALTGESFPRELLDSQQVFQGSHIVAGRGLVMITATGDLTKFGKVILTSTSGRVTTGFERGITRFGGLLIKSISGLVVSIFVINIVLSRPIIESLLFSLALAVGLTPQLLPVIISVSLSVGARQMAKQKVLVKRLDAIEDLGGITVLCTDKTGTLTTGEVKVEKIINIKDQPDQRISLLAQLNASLQTGFNNPIDTAILASSPKLTADHNLLGEIPYDFLRRRLSVLTNFEGQTLVTKGAHKEILEICTKVRFGDAVVPIEPHFELIDELFTKYSSQGNRIISIATKQFSSVEQLSKADESEMVFEGFLLLTDPPKADVKESLAILASQGIEIHLITGDNLEAARSLAEKVGLTGKALTGLEIAQKSPIQIATMIKGVKIFAAIDPLQKESIVKALQINGETVGFFGDGINDSPALHAADVGISVDTGVDVAKNAASIVLLEKDLTVLSRGITLGRQTFINTLKYIRVGVSAAFGNVVSMAIAAIFLPFLPLLPAQILLLNFLTDFPAVTISGDLVDKESLEKPKIWDVKQIQKLMIIFGLISTVFDLITFAVLRIGFNASPELFRTAWFIESAFTEIAVLMVLRTNRAFWRSRPGKGLLISSIILAITALAIPLTPFGVAIGFVALPIKLIFVLFGLIAIYIGVNEIAKRVWWY